METNTPRQRGGLIELPVKPFDTAELIDVQRDDNDTARSEDNVLQWMSYLPEDCIKAMIAMGWDVTT
jgi:hypothetical protein